MKKLTIIFFILLANFALGQDIFYISPSGNDGSGSGTIGSPWLTLNKVWEQAAFGPGDTVLCRGGNYNWNTEQRLTGKNGTAGNLITVKNYPGEVPNFEPGSSYDLGAQHELIYGLWNYIHWKGFEVSGLSQTPGTAVWSAFRCGEGSNNIYENIRYYNNCAAFRLMGQNSTNNLVLNCDFFNNKDPYGVFGDGFEPYGAGDGLAINEIGSSSTLTVRGCRFYDNSDDGMDLFDYNGFATIDGNWSFRNGFIPGTSNVGGDGSGYKFGHMPNWFNSDWAANTLKRVITNNLSAYNRVSGFNEAGLYAGAQLYNNTTISEGYLNFYFDYGYGTGYANFIYYFTNNVSYNEQNNWLNEYIVYTTNSFSPQASDFISLDPALLTQARQSDGSLPVNNFARPAAGSSLINSGTDVGLPFNESAPDRGAFETGSVGNQAPTSNAGSDQSFNLYTSTASLTGGGTDPDGTIASYQWTIISQPTYGAASITSPNSQNTGVTNLIYTGVYTFQLTVIDDDGASDGDIMTVTVSAAGGNSSPAIQFESNPRILVLPTNSVTLYSDVTDADGSVINYNWVRVSGPNIPTLSTVTSANLGIGLSGTAMIQGTYVFQLTVIDNGGATVTQQITVIVQVASLPPAGNIRRIPKRKNN
jgi:hypothetical protein